MNTEMCLCFAREHPVCQLATIEGSQPRVRTVLLWFADSSGFYFILLTPKQVTRQLLENPRAEVCFHNHPADLSAARQLRIAGRMERVEDSALHVRAGLDRAFLSTFAGRAVDDLIQVFRLVECDARFWGMTDVLKEQHVPHCTIAGAVA